MACWRTKGDSNRRYSSENISLRCRPNFRSCAAKWPAEKNPQKGAKIWFAPWSHGPVLGQRNGATMRFLSSGHFGHQRRCPEPAARRGHAPAGTDRVGVMDQVSPPEKIMRKLITT